MKFVLFIIMVISALLAISAFFGSSLGWYYFPTTSVGVGFYEYNSWIVMIHVLVALTAMLGWPYFDSRKTMAFISTAFVVSILINFGSNKIYNERETIVKIDELSYRVSSLEFPSLNYARPYSPSPFNLGGKAIMAEDNVQSLHFSPTIQYGYPAKFPEQSEGRFFIALFSKTNSKTSRSENSVLVIDENHMLEFYPDDPFENPKDFEVFQDFIKMNLPEIREYIETKRISS